ncbi:hypothetical protein PT043_08935, partial [Erysipelothrix rhusiopathiae]|nr:hypothetical protein [Erysipelothrix rhusiopathiae]
ILCYILKLFREAYRNDNLIIRFFHFMFYRNSCFFNHSDRLLDVRTRLSVEVQQEVRKYFKERVYKSNIPRNVKLSEAPSRGNS